MNNREKSLWSLTFVIICMQGLGVSTVQRAMDSVINIYAESNWNSMTYAGWMSSSFAVGSIVACIFCGNLSDRLGRKTTLALGILLFVSGMFPLLFPLPLWTVLLCRVVQGVGRALALVAATALVADVVCSERLGEGMGYFGLGQTLANAIGPSVALWMLGAGSFNTVFLCCIGIYVFMLVISRFIRAPERRTESVNSAAGKPAGFSARRFVEPGALPASVVMLFMGASWVCIISFLTLYAPEELGVGNTGMFFTCAAAGMVITRSFCGRLFDRYGALPVMVPFQLVGILSYTLLTFLCRGNETLFLLCGFGYGLWQGCNYSTLQAISVVDSPPDRRGAANSTVILGLDTGILAFSFVAGIILDHFGYTAMYSLSIGMQVITLALILLLLSNPTRARHREKQGLSGITAG